MEYNQQAVCYKMYRSEQQSSFLNLAISIPLLLKFMQLFCTLSAYNQIFHHMYVHVDIKKDKNKNIFKKMSEYVGFSVVSSCKQSRNVHCQHVGMATLTTITTTGSRSL